MTATSSSSLCGSRNCTLLKRVTFRQDSINIFFPCVKDPVGWL
ncbi:unnamed protein product [Larinioides sclopetarius]|uniref:Uncharacterized protein n=1 Tax=Larinioides sclopetarius TaxID=280406 RepID=A0AAV2BGI0_9ARAC